MNAIILDLFSFSCSSVQDCPAVSAQVRQFVAVPRLEFTEDVATPKMVRVVIVAIGHHLHSLLTPVS